jgi:hypothetical protein
MSAGKRESWLQRLFRSARRQIPAGRGREPISPSADLTVISSNTAFPGTDGLRSLENWRNLVRQGQRVVLNWDGGPHRGTVTTEGTVRLTFEDAVWIWLDQQLPDADRPTVGQAMQMLVPSQGAMILIPCQLVDEGRGSSLQVMVSGRLKRIQRRDDVRARVELPPVSAVRLGPGGRPIGLTGLRILDLSAGGIRAHIDEPLASGERIKLSLRLDNGQPLTPTVEILIGGIFAQGRFDPMPERDRKRIVQFVYRQELARRQNARPGNSLDGATLQ